MSLINVPAGSKLPEEFNVVIEIPMNGEPVKYEVDKETGAVFVDRFLICAMHYPCNYGYIPQTLSLDGDPVDVLVLAPCAVAVGSVIKCRPIGVLKMEDESGVDAKVLAVPTTKLFPTFERIQSPEDLPVQELERIKHFFEHYKDLEKGKWVKVIGWEGADAAKEEILSSKERYKG
ncbi:inorganic diphosphatase [Basilea psittacipulmonis]|uniref:Inorganic pyrophosphatase n=1 Tax=Basilea psittacipulmonis DSM 24701 TaxID=1072685 RepID=A0A077DDS4_9BURK|nr:inorganic diphosphatase [Basilea psittacipulmonis]AIL32754.1 inorganic pyrophosphatase [Basilea psittacipulmonis DSM 24701]